MLVLLAVQSAALAAGPLAAFSVLDPAFSVGLAPQLGRGTKHPNNPLWTQDTPWENRIDNGYVDVIHDPADPLGSWRLWYTAFITCEDRTRDKHGRYANCGGGSRQVGMLTANSTDGISWVKPLMDLQCYVPGRGAAANCSVAGAVPTNIVMPGVIGTSVFLDTHEVNQSKRLKVVGAGVLNHADPGKWPNTGGVCAGSDGLHFPHCIGFDNIPNVHWDTWDNMFFDDRTQSYISTMRANNLNSSNPCRDFYPGCITKKRAGCTLERCYNTRRVISRVQSAGPNISTMGADGGNTPIEYAADPNHQNYVQATFPYLNVYIGAPRRPLHEGRSTKAAPRGSLHEGYLGVLMVYEAASMRQDVHCKLAWSNDTITWHAIDPNSDLIPLGGEDSFESHICYGSIPVVDESDGSLRMYYFGGDGPHYGPRNSSLALSTFRPHGLAGVGAPATWLFPVGGRTTALLVSGARLVLSVDSDIPLFENKNSYTDAGYKVPFGSVTLTAVVDGTGGGGGAAAAGGAAGNGTTGLRAPAPIACTVVGLNTTEQAVAGCNLSSLVGQTVAFDIEISGGALLYTIGFSN